MNSIELISSFEDSIRIAAWAAERAESRYDRYFAYHDIKVIIINSGIDTPTTREILKNCDYKMYD